MSETSRLDDGGVRSSRRDSVTVVCMRAHACSVALCIELELLKYRAQVVFGILRDFQTLL